MPAVQLPWLPVVLLAAPMLAALACWLPALIAAQQDPANILSKE
jgi:ABC-type lipoprotein release transport system permease subunit